MTRDRQLHAAPDAGQPVFAAKPRGWPMERGGRSIGGARPPLPGLDRAGTASPPTIFRTHADCAAWPFDQQAGVLGRPSPGQSGRCPAPVHQAATYVADSGAERPRLAWALMLVQAACGLLTTIGLLLFTIGFAPTPGMVALVLFNAGKSSALVALAAGVVQRRRFARRATLVLESLSVLAGMASLTLDVLPGLATGAGLATLLVSVGLPSAVVALLGGPTSSPEHSTTASGRHPDRWR